MMHNKENVWNYPRPAIYEYHKGTIEVNHNNQILAKTKKGIRILETSHPPTYYFPLSDVVTSKLKKNKTKTFCEWKGIAEYYNYDYGNELIENVAWYYPNPNPDFLAIRRYVSFYSSKFNKCLVNNCLVLNQPGDFYGGWITSDLIGPFKGTKGTEEW